MSRQPQQFEFVEETSLCKAVFSGMPSTVRSTSVGAVVSGAAMAVWSLSVWSFEVPSAGALG